MNDDVRVQVEMVWIVCCAVAPGTTMRRTYAALIAMRIILTTRTTTLVSVAPELRNWLIGWLHEQICILSACVAAKREGHRRVSKCEQQPAESSSFARLYWRMF